MFTVVEIKIKLQSGETVEEMIEELDDVLDQYTDIVELNYETHKEQD